MPALLFLGVTQIVSLALVSKKKGCEMFRESLEKYSMSYLVLLDKKDQACEEVIPSLRF